MKLARAGLFALLWTVGCLRFGYGERALVDPKPDASSREDAGMIRDADSAVDEDAGRVDAGASDASTVDASTLPPDAAGMDDASRPVDDASADAAAPEPSDSGGMDGSSPNDPDAGLDGGVEPPVDRCPELPNALFCDGFEDAEFERWSQPLISNGAAEQSTARVHSGSSSLRATTGSAGTTSDARMVAEVFDHQKAGDIWLRFYFYLPSATAINASIVIASITETEEPYFETALSLRATGTDVATSNVLYRRTTVLARDAWVCVEMHVRLHESTGFIEAFFDGTSAARSGDTDTIPDTGYTSFDVGLQHMSSGQAPLEAFVDDVVAATTRVGCD